jgi:hypothetical protein
VETGNRRTEDAGGAPLSEENVIRLPREWVGPPEELVPIGPGARARAAQREAEAGMPTPADAFWSEDAAALHDAVQAPAGAARRRLEPPAGLVPPVSGLQPVRLRQLQRLGRLPRLGAFHPGGRPGRLPWRWGMLAVPAAALVALVVVMIGITQSPAPHRASSHTGSSAAGAAARPAASTDAPSDSALASLLRSETARKHSTVRVPARTRARGGSARKPPHRATSSHHATASPPQAVTEAATPPATSHSTARASTPTTPSASTASTSSSVRSKPATARPGPMGFGSISGGCNPKCS